MFYADFRGEKERILWNFLEHSDISRISRLPRLLDLSDDCLHWEIEPLVEGDRAVAVLVHGGEHVFPVFFTKGRQVQTQPAIAIIDSDDSDQLVDCDQQNEILLHTSWESRWERWWEWQTRPGPPCRPWIFLLQNLISVFQYLYLNYWQISFPTCQRLLYLYSEVFLIKHLVYLYFDVFLFPPVSICSLESFPVEEIERLVLIWAARAPALIWI